MTEEELREELLQEQKEGSKVLPSVSVTVVFTGTLTFEYENVTYEEAKKLAIADYSEADLGDADISLDYVE
jgi:hypothetical protein|uniref:Uncharacterized protein n=1 Tax=Myoviridae sp. ctZgq1 TaxID=2826666 RepID=A0A8S5LXD3_9CAUD|nr:MAG TPA: hypothetical protein [Myoviridae sp. ctZgq1]